MNEFVRLHRGLAVWNSLTASACVILSMYHVSENAGWYTDDGLSKSWTILKHGLYPETSKFMPPIHKSVETRSHLQLFTNKVIGKLLEPVMFFISAVATQ